MTDYEKDPSSTYDIGFGKPPKATRFKKGRSGNPKGRPKGSANFSTDLKDTLNTKLTVRENGKQKSVSTQKAALMRLREKALSGDTRALDRLLALAAQYNDPNLESDLQKPFPKDDQSILENYANRIRRRDDTQERANSEEPCSDTQAETGGELPADQSQKSVGTEIDAASN